MTQSYEHLSMDSAHSSLDGASLSLPLAAAESADSEPPAAEAPLATRRYLPSVPAPPRSELAIIVALTALLHAGGALAAFTAHDAPTLPRPLSRVQIQVARPRVIPAAVPPAPPPQARPKPTPVSRRVANIPEPEPQAEPTPVAPVDTGSSAPAAEDGALFAGSGGLGTAAPAPPPPPAPVVAPPAPVVQAREGANYAKNPRPAYPGLARRQGWEGTTLLSVQVTPSGRAAAVRIQRSSGRAALDDAALAAVKGWTFVPATQGGSPVAGTVTVPIVFKLQ